MCVEVHVTAGPARGRSFLFEKPGHLIFGRAPDAHICVPDDQYVSRRHFELLITPPTCRLRDLNSANGVFINGVHYGGQPSLQPDSSAPRHIKEVTLDDGDEIVVRETRISISIRANSETDISTQIIRRTHSSLLNREVALLLLTIPQATHPSNPKAETLLSSLIGAILTRIKRHPSSTEMLFLKYLEKGLLMAFPEMEAARNLALELFDSLPRIDEPIRMALHWGAVRTRPNGDVFGREVHRVYRVEGVQPQQQASYSPDIMVLFQQNRLLITQQGLAQLPEPQREAFTSVGKFRMEGFDEPCELWILMRNT
jgi:class 3 adenylate cyclase